MDDRKPVNLLAFGLLIMTSVIIGFQQIGLKATAEFAAPMLQIGLRSLGAAVIIAILIRLRGERIPMWGPVAWAGTLSGLLFALEYIFLAESLKFTTASHAVVFLYTAPIFAAFGLQFFIPSERLSRLQWIGMAVAALGLTVAFLGKEGNFNTDIQHMLLGDTLALLGGICWGATTIAIRMTVLKTTSATITLFYQLIVAAAVLLPVAIISGQSSIKPDPLLWANLLFQTIIVCSLSFFIWLWLLNRFIATQLGVYSFLTPLFGVIFGVFVLGEPISQAFVVGGIGVVLGILLVNLRSIIRDRRKVEHELRSST
jgi:drug/metabolite transporter (DMT)-like permease